MESIGKGYMGKNWPDEYFLASSERKGSEKKGEGQVEEKRGKVGLCAIPGQHKLGEVYLWGEEHDALTFWRSSGRSGHGRGSSWKCLVLARGCCGLCSPTGSRYIRQVTGSKYHIREDLLKKECLLSGIAQISPPPPPSPQFGQLGPLFSDVKNDVLRVWQKKSTDDDDDGWHDNYDGDGDNIDEIDDNNDLKTYKYYDFWVKID